MIGLDQIPLNVMWELPDNWCEEDHLAQALGHAAHLLAGLGLQDRFIFVVTSVGDRLPLRHADRVVVLQTSDEGHEVPDYLDDAFLVFKNYRPFTEQPENLRVIPLGCNKDVPDIEGGPVEKRSLDLFFVGRPLHREPFFEAVARVYAGREDLKYEIGRSPDFREGLPPADYARTLADTKIALSPRGVSHETFRTYEALRAGCVVIADRQLPAWFNTGWPVIELDDWSDLGAVTDSLLGDSARMSELSAAGLAWWREKCSPEAVAHYVVRELALKLMVDQRQ